MANRWIWNNTIGPLESRPGHQGAWGYPNTDALGKRAIIIEVKREDNEWYTNWS